MAVPSEIILQRRAIESFGAAGLMGPGLAVQHLHSLPPARIALKPIEAGRTFLQNWQLREFPDQGLWLQNHYDSFAPPLFLLHGAMVHSGAGITAIGEHVIAETLAHTTPWKQGYRNLARGIAIPADRITRLPGIYISLLAGGSRNYFHSLLLSLARLSAVPDNYLAAAQGILVPEGGMRQQEVLDLLDLMPSLQVREVPAQQTLLVDTLILPLSVCGDCRYHPCTLDFFRRLNAAVAPSSTRFPRRFYIDRRSSPLRPLRNEAELVRALALAGIEPIQPETLSLTDQIRLFRNAELIVAPHGAALTNLGFCKPGTRIVELLMDAYANWCFRNLAGLARLDYDCVLGRARQPWREVNADFHQTPWEVSVTHVAAAVTSREAVAA